MLYLSDDQRHLVCYPYSVEGLHAMAEALGIKRCWFHGGRLAHYDVPKRRVKEMKTRTHRVSARIILAVIKGLRVS